nr:hypothetical protein [Oedogonium sp. 1_circle_47180]
MMSAVSKFCILLNGVPLYILPLNLANPRSFNLLKISIMSTFIGSLGVTLLFILFFIPSLPGWYIRIGCLCSLGPIITPRNLIDSFLKLRIKVLSGWSSNERFSFNQFSIFFSIILVSSLDPVTPTMKSSAYLT